jgi:hypothetical protein
LTGSYTLTATDGVLVPAVSSTVTIIVGVAAKLRFSTQPSGAVGGVTFGTQPAVSILDAGGNVTASASAVTLTLTVPAGATLTCNNNPKTAVAGVATFAGCQISISGTYTLTATDGALIPAVSSSVEITGVASKLVFTTQPSPAATGGAPFATRPVVTVEDATGHTVIANSSVTLALTTTFGATFACTVNPKTANAGVANFEGCNINLPGTYTLTATDGALTPAISNNVVVTVGRAAKLAFTTQPIGAAGGAQFATQPVVTVEDAGGNTVTSNASSVLLTVTGSPVGVVLTCTANPLTAASGVATFAACNINLAGTYTLTATDGSLTSTVSNTVTIT